MKETDDKKDAEEERLMRRLKTLIVFDPIDSDMAEKAKAVNLNILEFEDVISKGREAIMLAKGGWNPVVPSRDDCPMFSYTSGTTGDPKGVKLTHGMLCGTSGSVQMWLDD